MTEFVFRSRLDPSYRAALERAIFFNPASEHGLSEGAELFGPPVIASDLDGLYVVVSRRQDAQCLFALTSRTGPVTLAGVIVFLRTSRNEMTVLHVAVVDQLGRKRESSLAVVVALVGAVRRLALRLRGIKHVRNSPAA